MQNQSQKVQERHGTTQDTQSPNKKIKLRILWSQGSRGSTGVDGSYFPIKGAAYFLIFPVWRHPAVFMDFKVWGIWESS